MMQRWYKLKTLVFSALVLGLLVLECELQQLQQQPRQFQCRVASCLSARSFEVHVDPRGLSAGAHYAEVGMS